MAEAPAGPGGGETGGERRVVLDAWAKVNLRLRVFPPDATGFHPLETIFLRIGLGDGVEVEPVGSGLRLEVEWEGAPEPLPSGEENLAWRAAEAWCRAAGRAPAARIRLRKRIPVGAGLGGGSADAAAVLRALNAAHGEPLGAPALLALAGRLGSDVPFQALGAPMALGWGRGERLLPLAPPPARPGLVVLPPFRIATPDAYGWLDADRASAAPPGAEAGALPPPEALARWETLEALAENDFEGPVFDRHPPLAEARAALLGTGARVALLAGSGAALFALWSEPGARDTARAGLGPALGEGWRLLPAEAPPAASDAARDAV